MEDIAYAKINLALHVRAREPDGYHRIETIFAFAEDGDRIAVRPDADLRLEVTGPFAVQAPPGPDNLVLRAAALLRERAGMAAGAALRLDKRLPVASGIGGGSADAAAALRLLCRSWELAPADDLLLPIARALGADVPACLSSRTARGSGRGDDLVPVDGCDLAGKALLLVNPRVPLSTAAVFRGWDGVDRGPLGRATGWRNDLELSARTLVPEIGPVLESLENAPVRGMSGSGATCFGLFDDPPARDAAAAAIRSAHPGWWLLASRLR